MVCVCVCVLTDGEKEGVLAGVALTIGEENVKGTEGEAEVVGVSWKKIKLTVRLVVAQESNYVF